MPGRTRPLAITQPNANPIVKPVHETWTGNIVDLDGIGHGLSGLVLVIDKRRVIKISFGTPKSEEDMATERRAYSILAGVKKLSPHILECFELNNPRGLVLERCDRTLRHLLRSMPGTALPCHADSQRWAKQAAEGLTVLHCHKIIHADVGCHNMLLDSRGVLKLCDFGGSSVQGSHASTVYEVWSRLPSKGEGEPTTTSDLFAFGSAIYEMSTKELPYQKKSLSAIQSLYEHEQFPSVQNIATLGAIITKCWMQKYKSASEIVQAIDPNHLICCSAQGDVIEAPSPLQSPSVGELSQGQHLSHQRSSRSSPKIPSSSSSKSQSKPYSTTSSLFSSILSSQSVISTPFNKSANSSSSKKQPVKRTAHSHDQENPTNERADHKKDFQRPSRRSKTFTSRKTRYQYPLSQWMTKSLRRSESHPP